VYGSGCGWVGACVCVCVWVCTHMQNMSYSSCHSHGLLNRLSAATQQASKGVCMCVFACVTFPKQYYLQYSETGPF